ncbi:MAG: tRNA (adenosine(37)-N6)-threonylcarbamoyltransferase complex dimerization subunit type 1 TsaB [Clostridia bacterium]|nr:tRNA (adenosine(37)-N6)-threonylcarbamoyltransferase complex dimerization subunit type 1 TsaB [Clostridia bacterium]
MTDFLAIDTSSKHLTVLAQKGGKVALRFIPDCAMRHSTELMGEIEKALNEVSLTPRECGFFAAVTGPGSFTGIRIGIATAKGFALAANKPLLGVTAFDLVAYNVTSESFFAVIDAAHGHYYVCGYDKDKNVTFAPAYLSGEEVKALNAPLYGFEDLPLDNYCKTDIKNGLYPAICASINRLTDDISALYIRKSQAEEARLADKKVGI